MGPLLPPAALIGPHWPTCCLCVQLQQALVLQVWGGSHTCSAPPRLCWARYSSSNLLSGDGGGMGGGGLHQAARKKTVCIWWDFHLMYFKQGVAMTFSWFSPCATVRLAFFIFYRKITRLLLSYINYTADAQRNKNFGCSWLIFVLPLCCFAQIDIEFAAVIRAHLSTNLQPNVNVC